MKRKELILLAEAVASVLVSSTSLAQSADVGVCSIIATPASFDHQSISSQGRVAGLKETTSHKGNDYTTFGLLTEPEWLWLAQYFFLGAS